jgi:hypothetical protein
MRRTSLTAILALLSFSLAPLSAAELKVVPTEVRLTGPQASQRLLVLVEENGKVVGDRTPLARFSSSDEAVVKIDARGVVQAVGDGEATITARQDGKSATATVKVKGAKGETAPSFRNDVIPLLTKVGCNSGACHGALAGKGGFKLSLRGYDPDTDHFVITRQALGRRVDRLEPSRSLLLTKPAFAVPHGGGRKLEVDSTDFKILAEWIAAGAPAPRQDDPHITRLEVFPPEAVLKPKDTLQVVVRASYSDGTSRDVTHWAKFNSSEDLVASVDQEGMVKVGGHGEAAITVWYSNLVAANRIVSPLPNDLDGKVFTSAARNNFIDDLVLKKLEALRIPPSPLCSDHEFIRRAFLDAMGVLPTPQEVQKFITDKSPDKRAKLIDAILERPEFVDYWAHKWSDLMLVSTRKLSQPGVWSFYQFIRRSVADNKPWDRFAREVLTAQGGTGRNGAANYFVLHRDVTDLTESSSVTFMGMSITCARCHNHPLEKWTQDQYWGMANLFARVGLKNGDRPGEVSVQARPEGDVPHPRRGRPMPPTPLDGKALDLDSRGDRRQYFADWLTAKDNPFFAKALVNRVWRNFLGRGIVEAEDDLRQTNPPTNEELFNALAKDFVDHRFDVKQLVRTVMNSATYQHSSQPLKGNATDDRFYSHYLVRRLSAEVILDAYSQVTGVPTPFTEVLVGSTGGTSPVNLYPPGTRALQLPDSQLVSAFLDAFGRPERVQTCSCERQQDSSVGQALHLNNGQTLNDKLRAKGSRVEKWLTEKVGDEEALRRVYLLALSRPPTDAELKKFRALLAEAAEDKTTTRRGTLEDLFWSVLTSKEFVFNH